MPLNDRQIKHSKPKDKPYKLTDGNGLYLHITPAGVSYGNWIMRLMASVKPYPLVNIPIYPLLKREKLPRMPAK